MLPGFDSSYYLNAKLSVLQAQHTEWQNRDMDFLEAFFLRIGLTAESHYSMYGHKEGLNPNPYFNQDEYRFAKASQLVLQGHSSNMEKALEAFDTAWQADPYLHYLQYGAAEGLNPSNRFDESRYLSDKLNALKANPSSGSDWIGKEIEDLRGFFAGIGITALDHFIRYGAAEGLSASPVPAAEQVDPENTPWKIPHDRVVIPSNLSLEWVNATAVTVAPYNAIGLVTMTLNGQSAIGTGFLISPEHVLTSAHILLDERGNYNSAGVFKFYPAVNGDLSAALSCGANQVWIEKPFSVTDLYPTWPDDDLAIIRLDSPVGSSRVYLKPLLYNPVDTGSLILESSGYPAGNMEQDNPSTPGRDFYQWKVEGGLLGDSIYNQGAFRMTDTMLSSPGASGSPVYYLQNEEYVFIGVHSGISGDSPVSAAMDDDSYNWLMGILQADGYYLDHTLV